MAYREDARGETATYGMVGNIDYAKVSRFALEKIIIPIN
jgi:hypothetical protein